MQGDHCPGHVIGGTDRPGQRVPHAQPAGTLVLTHVSHPTVLPLPYDNSRRGGGPGGRIRSTGGGWLTLDQRAVMSVAGVAGTHEAGFGKD